MGSRILLASTLIVMLLALTHPAWAWSGGGYISETKDLTDATYGSRSHSIIVLSADTQASMPDALDAFYSHPVDVGQIAVMCLGGTAASGMLLKNHEKVVLVDPANRITGDAVQNLQKLDIVLITHEHYDHFSEPAVVAIQSKTGAIVVANPGAFNALSSSLPSDKLVRMRSGETRVLSEIDITAIASIHPGNEPLTYILAFSDFSAFHGSDSGFNSALSSYKGKAKLAMVPTGGASPTASPGDALDMVRALESSDVIPMHGTKDSNDRLGVLLAQQAPNVKYLRPQETATIAVDELSGFGFITVLVSMMAFFYALRLRNHRPFDGL